jgi:hypothetical protein
MGRLAMPSVKWYRPSDLNRHRLDKHGNAEDKTNASEPTILKVILSCDAKMGELAQNVLIVTCYVLCAPQATWGLNVVLSFSPLMAFYFRP